MDKLIPVGRLFFAIAFIAFGIQQFIYGDFIAGRAPAWHGTDSVRLIWAYLSGAVLIVSGLAIIMEKKGRWLAILSGLMIFIWAFLRQIPVAAQGPFLGGLWTMAGKALVLFGGAFAVAGTLPQEKFRRAGWLDSFLNATNGFNYLGRICLSIFLVLCGIQHFLFVDFVKDLVPGWIPGHFFWTYFAGGALIAGGIGILIPLTARLAAALTGLMIFLWFLMLHIPRAVAAPGTPEKRNEWIAVFEALAVSGIAFVLIQLPGWAKRNRRVR